MTDVYLELAKNIKQWGQDAGFQQVELTDFNHSGVYYYQLQTNDFTATRKMVVR